MLSNYSKLNNLIGWLVFAIAAFTYLTTVEPTVSFWDCGEYIATSAKLQVGHPPGAPFFQLVGNVFSQFAFGDVTQQAYMVNLVSALSSAFTILFLFWTITALGRKFALKYGELNDGRLISIFGSAVVGALAYTFSDSFWFSATEGEVYAMSSLFTAIAFWAIFKWENEVDTNPRANRWLIFIAYMTGLSIGVHILVFLTIPAIAMIYFFKKDPEINLRKFLLYNIIAIIILGVVFAGIIPLILNSFGKLEILFVNSFGLPFNSGTIFALLLLIGLAVWGLRVTRQKDKPLWNTAILSVLFIVLGYSTFVTLAIRSNANTPIDENNPEDALSLLAYYKREQYGDWPVLYGQYFNAPLDQQEPFLDGSPVYKRDDEAGKYVISDDRKATVRNFDSRYKGFFPRMWSDDGGHVQNYMEIAELKNKEKKPTFGQNIGFFFNYQLGHMWWRYFLWNFVGRQNDEQHRYEKTKGNWLSGINAIDAMRLGPQEDLPYHLKNSPARNTYYFLPFILGLVGMFFHFKKADKDAWAVLLFFLLTGIAVVIYTNHKPFEPRERDYAFVGSFYAFAIWVGLGVQALYELLSSKMKTPALAGALSVALTVLVPGIMAAENWDDHDRSNRYTARDIAKAYLDSCAPNAILFTNGDNDTFPLWYLQEVEGVKTDVRVCNLSLLNTDWYTEQMTKKAYESEPLPISFTEEQYRQYGVRDYLYVAGTNELTMGSSEIMPQWKPIMDAKIAANPDLFKAGYKNATNSLYAILAPTKFATEKADLYNAIPSMDSTATYYEFRNLIFNILSKGQEMFGMDMNQLTAVQNIMLQFNDSFDYLPADYAMKFLANDDNIQSRGQGNEFLILPSKGLRVDVNTENALAAGIIDEGDMDRVEDVIYWKIPKRVIYKADLMILDMIAHFDWKRPIYFAASADASTYLGLQKYFYAEGLVYKLVPIVVEQGTNPNSLGEVHKEKMYENLVTNFKYGNMMEEGVLIDYYIRRTMTNNYRVQFSVLADAYGEDYAFNEKKIELLERIQGQAGEPDQVVRTEIGTFTRSEIPTEIAKAKETMEFSKARATEVLDFSLQVMPEENVPLGKVMPQYVSGYFQVGNQEKGKLYAEKMFNIYEEELEYYLDIEPEFSAQMVNDMFDSYRGYFSVFQVTFSLCDDEAFIASLTERFSGMTNRVKMGLNPIRNYSSVSAQRVMGTFDSLFSTYKALFDMMGVQG